MNWQDEGYLLGKRKFRENANIIDVFTNKFGMLELAKEVLKLRICPCLVLLGLRIGTIMMRASYLFYLFFLPSGAAINKESEHLQWHPRVRKISLRLLILVRICFSFFVNTRRVGISRQAYIIEHIWVRFWASTLRSRGGQRDKSKGSGLWHKPYF